MNTNPNKIPVGYGYRLLDVGENYVVGRDSFYDTSFGKGSWYPVGKSTFLSLARNPITIRTPIDVGDGYRLVEIGEMLEEGDETIEYHCCSENDCDEATLRSWRATTLFGNTLSGELIYGLHSNGNAYRRKLDNKTKDSSVSSLLIRMDKEKNNPECFIIALTLDGFISRMLLTLFKEAGYQNGYGAQITAWFVSRESKTVSPDLGINTITTYDPATQMGEIINLMTKPYVDPAPEGPTIHGYKAKYEKGSGYVQFGCYVNAVNKS